jgi:hypothetical protein
MKKKIAFSFAISLLCLLMAAGRAARLHRNGWPFTDGLLIAMIILAPIAFIISFAWYSVKQNHDIRYANKVVVIPIAIALALALLGWAGYIYYSNQLDTAE